MPAISQYTGNPFFSKIVLVGPEGIPDGTCFSLLLPTFRQNLPREAWSNILPRDLPMSCQYEWSHQATVCSDMLAINNGSYLLPSCA
jgi:hypothetical protein